MNSLVQCPEQSVGAVSTWLQVLLQTIILKQCDISAPSQWKEDYGPTALKDGLEEYDFVIVGAGTAGSVVASRLAENPAWKIMLLDAGGDPPVESVIPQTLMALLQSAYTFKYIAKANASSYIFHGNLFVPCGKMLGGTHAMNELIYTRGAPRDYDLWEKLGCTTWNWQNAKKYFALLERRMDRNNATGTQVIAPFISYAPSIDAMLFDAYRNDLHLQELEDPVITNSTGIARSHLTMYNGERHTTFTDYINAKCQTNLHLIKNALATKIKIKNKRAVSVEFIHEGTTRLRVKAKKEIILSAGAIESAKLLMLSGIGPKAHLESAGIPVIKDLPVGENLHDHIAAVTFFEMHRSNPMTELPFDRYNDLYSYLTERTGRFATNVAQSVAAYISSSGKSIYPDIQYVSAFFRRNDSNWPYIPNPGIWNKLTEHIMEAEVLLLTTSLLNPKSRGYVRLNVTSPYGDPDIAFNYYEVDNDLERLSTGVKKIIELSDKSVFKENEVRFIEMPFPACDTLPFGSDEYLRCYTREATIPMRHQVGSSRMGPINDPTSVVDPLLRVIGIKSLRQADAGIEPVSIPANSIAGVIMIAERAADIIKSAWNYPTHVKVT